jgi:hypothetical protein
VIQHQTAQDTVSSDGAYQDAVLRVAQCKDGPEPFLIHGRVELLWIFRGPLSYLCHTLQ